MALETDVVVEGRVVNGVVILNGGSQLPELTRVRLEWIDPAPKEACPDQPIIVG